jgi:hypothetical protein
MPLAIAFTINGMVLDFYAMAIAIAIDYAMISAIQLGTPLAFQNAMILAS